VHRLRVPALLACLLVLGSSAPAVAQGALTVSVEVVGNAGGSVASEPPGIACPPTCSAPFPEGTSVTLIATPEPGASFGGWGQACTGTGPCALTLDRDVSVTARFDDAYRPGLMIRGPGQTRFRGRWVVQDVPGPEQTVGTTAGRGQRVVFTVRLVNDGVVADPVVVSGTGDRGGASVAYRVDGRDVTEEVVAGALRLEELAPGDEALLKVVVEVSETAALGARRAWVLTAVSGTDPTSIDAVRAEVKVVWRPVPFSRALGLTLVEPGREIVAVTFHESLFGSAAALRPLGHLLVNANPSRFDPPPDTPGPGYIVMDSRGRPTPPTSAADIVMLATTPVRSPVTGRVMSVTPYRLYCSYPDVRVMIRPADAPSRSVMLVHLTGVRVERGDRLVAGRTVVGRPRPFPFPYDTDDYVPGGHPHVHVEIERDGSSPLPGCR
jgi:hypothetical protein